MTEKKQSISAIREIFAAASETELPALYLEYEEDSRAGVQNLIQKYQKQEEALKKERERTEQMKIYEHKYEDLAGSAASTRSEEALWRALWSQVRSFCRATVKSCI